MNTPVHTTPEGASGDLKRSKAELFRATAKVLGVVAISAGPALAGWIDASNSAATAVTATATERATSEASYEKLVNRINDLEEDTRKLSIEVAVCNKLMGFGSDPHLPDVVLEELDAPGPEETMRMPAPNFKEMRAPMPKLSTKRPEPLSEAIQQAHQSIQEAF